MTSVGGMKEIPAFAGIETRNRMINDSNVFVKVFMMTLVRSLNSPQLKLGAIEFVRFRASPNGVHPGGLQPNIQRDVRKITLGFSLIRKPDLYPALKHRAIQRYCYLKFWNFLFDHFNCPKSRVISSFHRLSTA